MAGFDEKTNVLANPLGPHGASGPREQAYLVVLAGTGVGEMFKVSRGRMVIGRGGTADIRLVDEGISRDHAAIIMDENGVFLEDLGSTNGTFCNGTRVSRQELRDGDKILVGSTTILKFTYPDELEKSFQRQMYESALRDGLTGAFNRRYFMERLDSEFAYAVRHRSALCLLILDIDHFKKVNDTHGHLAGDHVLSEVASVIAGGIRVEDVFARYGGEEFALICRGIEIAQGRVVGERLRLAVAAKTITFDEQRIQVTISAGIGGLWNSSARQAQDLIAAADAALYEAKRRGRNRVAPDA